MVWTTRNYDEGKHELFLLRGIPHLEHGIAPIYEGQEIMSR
jgi:hypothetical protein